MQIGQYTGIGTLVSGHKFIVENAAANANNYYTFGSLTGQLNSLYAQLGTFISGVSISGGAGIRGALNINAGSNITLTQQGNNTLSISSAGGGSSILNATTGFGQVGYVTKFTTDGSGLMNSSIIDSGSSISSQNWIFSNSTAKNISGGVLSQSMPVLDLFQAWTGATLFTGIKLEVSEGGSNSKSLLLSLGTNGANKFTVDKNGRFGVYNQTADLFYGIDMTASRFNFILFDTQVGLINAAIWNLGGSQSLGWSAGVADGGPDASLSRFSAGTVRVSNNIDCTGITVESKLVATGGLINILAGASGTVASTGTYSAPSVVYGQSNILMGNPAGWLDILVSGVARKIPYY